MLFCLKGPVELFSSNRCIVFLHGFLGSCEDWSLYIDHFSSLGDHVMAIDLPGHGKSSDYEIEELFDVIPKGAHLVGYSMGGRLALYLNFLRKDWFSSLTLLSTNPGLKNRDEIEDRLIWENEIVGKLKRDPLKKFVKDWYSQNLFSGFDPPQQRFEQNRESLIACFRKFSIAKLPSLWDHLNEICLPIQMAFGETDQKYMKLKQEIEKIDTCRRIRTLSVKGCSHPIHLEAASLLIDAIENLTRMVKENA